MRETATQPAGSTVLPDPLWALQWLLGAGGGALAAVAFAGWAAWKVVLQVVALAHGGPVPTFLGQAVVVAAPALLAGALAHRFHAGPWTVGLGGAGLATGGSLVVFGRYGVYVHSPACLHDTVGLAGSPCVRPAWWHPEPVVAWACLLGGTGLFLAGALQLTGGVLYHASQ